MKDKVKYLLSIVLIFSGVVLIYLSYATTVEESDATYDPLGVNHISFDFSFLPDELLTEKNPGILPVLLLATHVCSPCLNNVVEYAELFADHDVYNDVILLFTEGDDKRVERFLITSDIGLPYLNLNSKILSPPFNSEQRQNLIFVDTGSLTAFYNESIPNTTTSLISKENLLSDVTVIWNKRFFLNKNFR